MKKEEEETGQVDAAGWDASRADCGQEIADNSCQQSLLLNLGEHRRYRDTVENEKGTELLAEFSKCVWV